MNIESRRSIHSEESKAKLDAGKSTSNLRENRRTRSDDEAKQNYITNIHKSNADETSVIHGSQEDLYEAEHSYSTSFKNKTGNNESLKSSPILQGRRTRSDVYETKQIYIECGDRSNADKTSVIHSSQEDLYEKELHEAEYSYSTSFKNKTENSESPKFSPMLKRRNRNVSPLRTEPIRPKHVAPKKTDQVSEKKCTCGLLTIVLACLGIFFVSFQFILSSGSEYTCSFDDLKKKYPTENSKLWMQLKSDVEDILNGRIDKPSVTLFVHKGNTGAKELIIDIAKAASNCIDSSLKPVEFNNSDFTSADAANDYGVVIQKYKEVAKEGNVVIIANLNEIPAASARALHSICDRETPILRKVVILLSLTAQCNGERPIDIAVEALSELWEGKIMENELGPLMTRVTDEVILLESK